MWGSPHRFRPSILWQEKAVQRVCIMDFAALPVILFALLMIAAGVGDMLSRRIPNLLTLTIAVGFFPSAWVAGMAWGMIALNGVIGFVLLLAGFALFSLRLFGGGDAKLIAAAGTWFGVQGLGHFLTMTVFAGGLLAIAIAIWWVFAPRIAREEPRRRLLGPRGRKPSVPYCYAVAAGALLALPQSWWGSILPL
jgi:prepilin peptidase CpaA